ncbi:MAG: hypothetical protein JNN25_07805 [Candidatus Kapabacteria bacterium]|nr:hypothetical protein [Candidatus Kapabacteria bacterium]
MMTIFSRYRHRWIVFVLLLVMVRLLSGCFLFPPVNPPDKTDSFAPTLEWVSPTFGAVMDVFPVGNIVSIGDRTRSDGRIFIGIQTFSPEGQQLDYSEDAGLSKEVVANFTGIYNRNIVSHVSTNNSPNYITLSSLSYTNPYTRYNTYRGAPDTKPYPYSGYVEVVGPSIAKATPERTYIYPPRNDASQVASIWMVGTFCDNFQSFPEYFEFGDPNRGKILFNHLCPTFGKADCFVLRNDPKPDAITHPVRHQWGGPENDLAYDVASDDIGNATIFLRAGSDFGITSATQSLVRMKTGYNIVRLDTNGLLTETFPVSLEAAGELTDTQIALGNSGAIYILAKDEVKKQYFLAKVSRSGTAWTRYLPTTVSNRENSIPVSRDARMGLTVDSKDCAYITGNFSGTVDFGGASLTSSGVQVFVAKYSASSTCLGALAMGSGLGVTVRLSPDEKSLYVNGWAVESIMGTAIPDQNDERNGVLRPGAFLVKLKLTK